jgi:ABC-type dipeptide/oligopeptide/nickel transport system permease component
MQRYIMIRLVQSVFTLIGVSIIVFSLARLSGNPLDVLLPDEADDETFLRISELWGLNDPWYIQYFTFVKNASRGEFGPSFKWQGRTAMELVLLHLPATLQLAFISSTSPSSRMLPAASLAHHSSGRAGRRWS